MPGWDDATSSKSKKHDHPCLVTKVHVSSVANASTKMSNEISQFASSGHPPSFIAHSICSNSIAQLAMRNKYKHYF